MGRDVAASIEVFKLSESYHLAPRSEALRVRILALDRRKPPALPETRCDGLPATSQPVAGPLHWSVEVLIVLFWIVLLFEDFAMTLWGELWVRIWARVTGRQLPRWFRVLQLDNAGVYLSDNRSAPCFIPYALLRSVQTYLDEPVGEDARRGVILGAYGGPSITLELGENTAKVVSAISRHTELEVLHCRCSWLDAY